MDDGGNRLGPREGTWRRLPVWLFGGFWALGVAFFSLRYLLNPQDPTLEGIQRYGHTYASELAHVLRLTAAEIPVAAALLRPWNYRRSWGRALTAATLLAPWLLLRAGVGMHAGPATHAHTLWLALFWIGLVSTALVSGIAAVRARRRSAP
jgi:hypothetical protein